MSQLNRYHDEKGVSLNEENSGENKRADYSQKNTALCSLRSVGRFTDSYPGIPRTTETDDRINTENTIFLRNCHEITHTDVKDMMNYLVTVSKTLGCEADE